MNQVVKFDASVPAFLQNADFLALNRKAAAGLSSGAPTRISFRGSRFRFVAADGAETPLPDNGPAGANSLSLDVIVVDASEHISKFFYEKAYDPNSDDSSPACYSDNGVGPSNRANKPQSLLCANCPKNVWGSKVTPQGSQVKACSDVKKIVVVPVSNIDGPAYMLGIPGASLKTWVAAVNAVSTRNIPIPALVFQLGFESGAEFPKLTFNPVRYISQAEDGQIQDLFGSDEVSTLVGRNDVPITSLPAAAAAPAQNFANVKEQQSYAPPPQVSAVHQRIDTPIPFSPPAQAADPNPMPAFLQRQPVPQAPAQPTPAAAPRRRGRPASTPPVAPVAATAGAAPDIEALLDKALGGAQ